MQMCGLCVDILQYRTHLGPCSHDVAHAQMSDVCTHAHEWHTHLYLNMFNSRACQPMTMIHSGVHVILKYDTVGQPNHPKV